MLVVRNTCIAKRGRTQELVDLIVATIKPNPPPSRLPHLSILHQPKQRGGA